MLRYRRLNVAHLTTAMSSRPLGRGGQVEIAFRPIPFKPSRLVTALTQVFRHSSLTTLTNKVFTKKCSSTLLGALAGEGHSDFLRGMARPYAKLTGGSDCSSNQTDYAGTPTHTRLRVGPRPKVGNLIVPSAMASP